MKVKKSLIFSLVFLVTLLIPSLVIGEGTSTDEAISNALFTTNNVWMLVSTFLVFIMHLGFSCLEIGFTRAKNTVNVLFKNTLIVSIGLLTYALVGFNLMYPGEFNGILGFAGFGISSPEGAAGLIEYAGGSYTYWTDFIFQAMFAATAGTIVSGAVAERIKLSAFLIFSTVYIALVYPIVGSWQWGKGWLYEKGFHDFAGSTLVHSVGGWAALTAIIFLGPRIGKFINGKSQSIKGHSMPLAAIGAFLLWFGWYGFNGGSVLSADPAGTSLVFVTTSLSAAAGVVIAPLFHYLISKDVDLTMALNGALAGLVGVTAGADVVSPMSAIIIGSIAGIIIVASLNLIDKVKLDDPVGAVSVHLSCGIWGTLAVGIFAENKSFNTQLIGVLAYGGVCLVASTLIWLTLKYTMGIRISKEDELIGLDESEHKSKSYPDFVTKKDAEKINNKKAEESMA